MMNRTTGSRELALYTYNGGNQFDLADRYNAIVKNLNKKFLTGKYDPEKALKAMYTLVTDGAKSYTKCFCSPDAKYYHIFSVADRKAAAEELLELCEEEITYTE